MISLTRTGKPGAQGPVTPQRQDDPQDDTWYSIFPVENDELVYGTWEDEVNFLDLNMSLSVVILCVCMPL